MWILAFWDGAEWFEQIFDWFFSGYKAKAQEVWDFMYCFYEGLLAPTVYTMVEGIMPDWSNTLSGTNVPYVRKVLATTNQFAPVTEMLIDIALLIPLMLVVGLYRVVKSHIPFM